MTPATSCRSQMYLINGVASRKVPGRKQKRPRESGLGLHFSHLKLWAQGLLLCGAPHSTWALLHWGVGGTTTTTTMSCSTAVCRMHPAASGTRWTMRATANPGPWSTPCDVGEGRRRLQPLPEGSAACAAGSSSARGRRSRGPDV